MIKINSVLGRILITLYFTWVFETHVNHLIQSPSLKKIIFLGLVLFPQEDLYEIYKIMNQATRHCSGQNSYS